MRKFVAAIVLLFFLLPLCRAQYKITGKVTDDDKKPIQGVSITAGDSIVLAVTDSAGNYSFQYHSAFVYLSFTHVGYFPATILIKGATPVTLYRSNSMLPATLVRSFERNSILINIPAAVSVLNSADLGRYGAQTFVPAMNTVPGVKMDERSPGSYRLSIRGNILRSTFGVRNVKIYWNGIPFTDANGTTYFNELALNDVDRIEILKGPSGSMYGAGTGGVLLLSNDLHAGKERNISGDVSGGSYDMLTANAAFHQSNSITNTSLTYSHQQSHGYRQQSAMRRDAGNYSGTISPGKLVKLHAIILYSDLYYQTPGGLTQAELNKDPKQARPAAGTFQSAVKQQAAVYLKTLYAGIANESRFGTKWLNTTSIYSSYTDFKNPTIRNYEAKIEKGIGGRTVFQYKHKGLTATAGGEYQYGFTNTGTYGNKLGVRDSLQFHDDIDARQFNIFLQGDYSISEKFIVNAGLSYNNFHFGFLRTSVQPLNKTSSDFTPALVPRISVLKKIKSDVSVYVSVSKGFSPPSIDEVRGGNDLFNKGLDAETGINYEAGLKGNIIKNKLWIEGAVYYFRLHNTIVSRRDSAGGDYYTNAGKTKQAGVELAASYMAVSRTDRFLSRLHFRASYTNIDAKFQNYQQATTKFDGNLLTGAVPNIVSAVADIETRIHLYANLTWTYTDKIPVNDANTFFSQPYNLAFVKVGYKINFHRDESMDFFISYDKSFNKPYSLGNDLNAAGNRFFNPSSPENLYTGIRLKFGL